MGDIGDQIADQCAAVDSDLFDFFDALGWSTKDNEDAPHELYLVAQDRVKAMSAIAYWTSRDFEPMNSADIDNHVMQYGNQTNYWSSGCWDAVPMSSAAAILIENLIRREQKRVQDNEYADSLNEGYLLKPTSFTNEELPDPWFGYCETAVPQHRFT
jgi:hypothetical protein